MKKIFLFTSIILMISCGTRKVQKHSEDIKQDVKESIVDTVVIQNNKKETIVDTSSVITQEFEPINPILPFTINGKIYQNVRLKTLKIKNGISSSKTDNSSLNRSISTEKDIHTDIKVEDKQIDRKSSIFDYWWVLIIIFTLGIVYYEFRK